MPKYHMKNNETGEEKEIWVSISEMEKMKEEGWQIVHTASKHSNLISQKDGTLSKTSSDWRDLLKNIKKGSGAGNTIKH